MMTDLADDDRPQLSADTLKALQEGRDEQEQNRAANVNEEDWVNRTNLSFGLTFLSFSFAAIESILVQPGDEQTSGRRNSQRFAAKRKVRRRKSGRTTEKRLFRFLQVRFHRFADRLEIFARSSRRNDEISSETNRFSLETSRDRQRSVRIRYAFRHGRSIVRGIRLQ